MSQATRELCDKQIDTDFHLETDGEGKAICNECAEKFEVSTIKSIEFVYRGVIITFNDGTVRKYMER